jgi:hypothetical protein
MPASDPNNVLSANPSGPDFGHNAKHFRPEVAVIFRAARFPALAELKGWQGKPPTTTSAKTFRKVRTSS